MVEQLAIPRQRIIAVVVNCSTDFWDHEALALQHNLETQREAAKSMLGLDVSTFVLYLPRLAARELPSWWRAAEAMHAAALALHRPPCGPRQRPNRRYVRSQVDGKCPERICMLSFQHVNDYSVHY